VFFCLFFFWFLWWSFFRGGFLFIVALGLDFSGGFCCRRRFVARLLFVSVVVRVPWVGGGARWVWKTGGGWGVWGCGGGRKDSKNGLWDGQEGLQKEAQPMGEPDCPCWVFVLGYLLLKSNWCLVGCLVVVYKVSLVFCFRVGAVFCRLWCKL